MKPETRIRVEPDFEDTWPGASALATECILNIGLWIDEVRALGEALARQHGIPSPAAFNALEILRGAGQPLPPSTIAARMIVTRPTMTGVLATLERHGLVRRLPHGRDKRMSLIEITDEGRARVERLLPELHEAERRIMDALSPDEHRLLLQLVARLQTGVPE